MSAPKDDTLKILRAILARTKDIRIKKALQIALLAVDQHYSKRSDENLE